jgi:hypothetical protein
MKNFHSVKDAHFPTGFHYLVVLSIWFSGGVSTEPLEG